METRPSEFAGSQQQLVHGRFHAVYGRVAVAISKGLFRQRLLRTASLFIVTCAGASPPPFLQHPDPRADSSISPVESSAFHAREPTRRRCPAIGMYPHGRGNFQICNRVKNPARRRCGCRYKSSSDFVHSKFFIPYIFSLKNATTAKFL